MVCLSALRRRPDARTDSERFPWTLPVVRALEELVFTTPLTFLVGMAAANPRCWTASPPAWMQRQPMRAPANILPGDLGGHRPRGVYACLRTAIRTRLAPRIRWRYR